MKFLLLLIIGVLPLSANLTFASEYAESLSLVGGSQRVGASHISEAKLLETYISSYKEKINLLYLNYSQSESIALNNANLQIDDMILALKKIQFQSVSEKDSIKVMKIIINDIKVLNIRMKTYLEQEALIAQEKFNKETQKYEIVGKKISSLLDSFIEKMTATLIKKEDLSRQEREIVRTLVRIRDENDRIKNFRNINFSSQEDIQSYFQNIIINIRKDIQKIKKLSS